jgi:hypothetical protein
MTDLMCVCISLLLGARMLAEAATEYYSEKRNRKVLARLGF